MIKESEGCPLSSSSVVADWRASGQCNRYCRNPTCSRFHSSTLSVGLGNIDYTNVFTFHPPERRIVAIAAGSEHLAVILDDGSLYVSGSNAQGSVHRTSQKQGMSTWGVMGDGGMPYMLQRYSNTQRTFFMGQDIARPE